MNKKSQDKTNGQLFHEKNIKAGRDVMQAGWCVDGTASARDILGDWKNPVLFNIDKNEAIQTK